MNARPERAGTRSSRPRPEVTSIASETIAHGPGGPQTGAMDTHWKATNREAAGRHPVNVFRLHHFAGLGCLPCV